MASLYLPNSYIVKAFQVWTPYSSEHLKEKYIHIIILAWKSHNVFKNINNLIYMGIFIF